jgi:hypothetical protein
LDAGEASDGGTCVPTTEVCNGLNEDCDRFIDEGDTICPQNLPFGISACGSDDAGVKGCRVVDCVEGYLDCVDDGPGCATEVSGENCGDCGTQCEEGQQCSKPPGSGFVCMNGCPPELPNICGSSCVDLDIDERHCGQCSDPDSGELHACAPVDEARPSCVGGDCKLDCVDGRGSCDDEDPEPGTPEFDNGCEINTDTNAQHCGGCGKVCPTDGVHTVAYCEDGMCKTRCEANFLNCDGAPGCEASALDNDHCGSCQVKCGGLLNTTSCCGAPPKCALLRLCIGG